MTRSLASEPDADLRDGRVVSAGTASQQQCNDTRLVKNSEVPSMLTEIAVLLSSPEQYVCCYRDGEIYIETAPVAGE